MANPPPLQFFRLIETCFKSQTNDSERLEIKDSNLSEFFKGILGKKFSNFLNHVFLLLIG
jgi:hypothetical protein